MHPLNNPTPLWIARNPCLVINPQTWQHPRNIPIKHPVFLATTVIRVINCGYAVAFHAITQSICHCENVFRQTCRPTHNKTARGIHNQRYFRNKWATVFRMGDFQFHRMAITHPHIIHLQHAPIAFHISVKGAKFRTCLTTNFLNVFWQFR